MEAGCQATRMVNYIIQGDEGESHEREKNTGEFKGGDHAQEL